MRGGALCVRGGALCVRGEHSVLACGRRLRLWRTQRTKQRHTTWPGDWRTRCGPAVTVYLSQIHAGWKWFPQHIHVPMCGVCACVGVCEGCVLSCVCSKTSVQQCGSTRMHSATAVPSGWQRQALGSHNSVDFIMHSVCVCVCMCVCACVHAHVCVMEEYHVMLVPCPSTRRRGLSPSS